MNMLGRVAITTAMLVPMVAAPVAAQNYRWDFGVNAGYAWYRAMLGSEETGLPDGTDWDDVKFEAGTRFGAQLGYWLKPKMGLRANFSIAERPVVAENYDLLADDTDTDDLFNNVNLWSGTIDLLFRFKAPNEEWMGREMLPYFALGIGGKWVNPAGDPFTCVDNEEDKSWSCFPFTPWNRQDPTNPANFGDNFALGEQKVLAAHLGLGTDIRLSPNFAIRLEASDKIYKPQVYLAEPAIVNNRVTLSNGDDGVSQIVHEIGADIGLHLLMGLARPEVVAVVPAPTPAPPAPTPPAPTPPAPAPPPRVDNFAVCVVDPTVPSGLRMQNVTFRYATNDTVVMSNGNAVPFRTSVGNVMTARNADWYVRGQPLTITMGKDKLEYLTYQGAVTIESGKLSYLGNVNGYPVYADRDEVADVIDAVNTLRRADASGDLGKIMSERKDLRDELEDVKFLYVPLEATGCVFQPLQVLEPVTKGKQ
jgi:opacity protein-like surface antigen